MFDIEDYKDKSILIIGGGTSTLEVQWENLKYDCVWTCNEFFMNNRVAKQDIDLYMLGYTVDLTDKRLVKKLKGSKTKVFFEPTHYRGKQRTSEYVDFIKATGKDVFQMEVPYFEDSWEDQIARKAGAAFRLIQLALMTEAKNIYFVGFDGFNKEFTNKHAFTQHVGLKDTDTRRNWEKDYYLVFLNAFRYLTTFPNHRKLQNLGEGLDFNIGTQISKKWFTLKRANRKILNR